VGTGGRWTAPCPLIRFSQTVIAVSHRLRQPVETEDFFQRLALAGRTRDLLVPLVFLGGQTPVLIWQISTLADRFTGMHLLTAAAFISMALPMIVFFSLQRYFAWPAGWVGEGIVSGTKLFSSAPSPRLGGVLGQKPASKGSFFVWATPGTGVPSVLYR
jgi:hypothetical protein